MKEELNKIFENVKSELLTEEVKNQIATLIEAKINEKVNEKTEEFKKEFETQKTQHIEKLEEKAVEYVDFYLISKMDEYLNFVTEEYMKQNELAIEDGLKASMYEKLIGNIKKVLAESQVKEDEVKKNEDIYQENERMKKDLNESIKREMSLKSEIKKLEAGKVFEEVTKDLTIVEREKLAKLVEDFEIDDVEEFRKKATVIKESLKSFPTKKEEEDEDVQPNSNANLEVPSTQTDEETSANSTVILNEEQIKDLSGVGKYL